MFISLSELKHFFPTCYPVNIFVSPFTLLFLSQLVKLIIGRLSASRSENAEITTFFNDLLEEERCLIYSLCCYSVVYRSHFFDADVPNGCSSAFYSLVECTARDFNVTDPIIEYTFINKQEGIYYAFSINHDFLGKIREEFKCMYESRMKEQGKTARYILCK